MGATRSKHRGRNERREDFALGWEACPGNCMHELVETGQRHFLNAASDPFVKLLGCASLDANGYQGGCGDRCGNVRDFEKPSGHASSLGALTRQRGSTILGEF